MVSARQQNDVVVAKSELSTLREICSRRTPIPTPSGIVDFLHLDALVHQWLVEPMRRGYTCTDLGQIVARMHPSESFSAAFLYRAADIALSRAAG